MHRRHGRYVVLLPLVVVGLASGGWSSSARAETTNDFETTRSLVGSYLAGRFARSDHDTSSAATFYHNALTYDPSNEMLLEQAFQMEASQANWPRALKLAANLVAVQPQHRLANLALALNAFKTGSMKKSEDYFKAAGTGPIGELTSALALAWVKLAEGDANGALKLLDMPKQAEWAQLYLRYHRALIADIVGRRQDAETAFERAVVQDTRTLRTSLAYARHAANGGDRKRALEILAEQLDKSEGDGHPLLRGLRDEIQSGAKIPLIVGKPVEGLAEVFYGLGEALISEGAVGIGILYMQMALLAVPDQQFALASLANAYEANKQYSEAIDVYNRMPADSPLSQAVEIRKAYNLNSLDRVDEARATLQTLLDKATSAVSEPAASESAPPAPPAASDESGEEPVLKLGSRGERVTALQEALKALAYDITTVDGKYGDQTWRAVRDFQHRNNIPADGLAGAKTYAAITSARSGAPVPSSSYHAGKAPLTANDQLEILDALGTIARSHKLYTEAVAYYDKALALVDKPEKRHWTLYYARGTSYERLKNWPAAEVDLKSALALAPDQPLVLNYLGYSWIDQGENMKEGMAHIEKAVALKPDDGYIVDSLGWAHFKQGNFEEAVRYLERAVELRPDDPVLNDHLGDALWKVGREREARFQWDQALSLKPEPDDADRIKKKLEHGLAVEAPAATAAATKQASQATAPASK